MSYRHSFVSLYRASLDDHPNNSAPVAARPSAPAVPPPFDEESPAEAPVFEGHLYLRTDKKQWQWRLFRFDGMTLTCLSTRKVPLPSHLSSKDNARLFRCPSSPDHYLLPKWTIDLINVSAVSLLSAKKKATRCFCVRTVHGQCYIMKAQKQSDLDHWLFALTKMWHFSQAAKKELATNQANSSPTPHPLQQHAGIHPHRSSMALAAAAAQAATAQAAAHQQIGYTTTPRHHSMPTQPSSASQQQQLPLPPPLPHHHQHHHQHQTPRSFTHPMMMPSHVLPTIGRHQQHQNQHQQQQQQQQHQQQQQQQQRPLVPPRQPPAFYSQLANTSPHLPIPPPLATPYIHPNQSTPMVGTSLSEEKRRTIDAWRRSLSELMATEPEMTLPPPMDTILDDHDDRDHHDDDAFDDDDDENDDLLTSVSHRHQKLVSSMLAPPAPPPAVSIKKQQEPQQPKVWIEKKAPAVPTPDAAAVAPRPGGPTSAPATDRFHVPYFQESSLSSSTLSSVRSTSDQNVQNMQNTQNTQNTSQNTSSRQRTSTSAAHKPHHAHMVKEETPLPSAHGQHLTYNATTSGKAIQIMPPSLTQRPSSLYLSQSPLGALAHVSENKDDDEISLAALQKSLKRASISSPRLAAPAVPPVRHSMPVPRTHSWIPSSVDKQPIQPFQSSSLRMT